MTSQTESTFTCPSCQNTYAVTNDADGQRELVLDYGVYAVQWGDLSQREICYSCWEQDAEYASTLVRFFDGEQETVRFGDDLATVTRNGTYVGDGDDLPDWFTSRWPGKRGYVKTDAWRGYYQTTFTGLVSLVDGWLTGHPDPALKPEREAITLNEALKRGTLAPPRPIYWLFEPTSNVFSMASEILVEEGDQETISHWLASHGYTTRALESAFS